MNIWDSIVMAVSSLHTRKLQSFLTMTGIVIGISSVILIVFIAQAGSTQLKTQIAGNGNTIEVLYQPADTQDLRETGSPFSPMDIEILSNIHGVKHAVASTTKFDKEIRYRDKQSEIPILGINETYAEVNEIGIKQGSLLNSSDFNLGTRVAVINTTVQEELFDGENPIGKLIYLGHVPVEIIGVSEENLGMLSGGFPQVYIPLKTMESIYGDASFDQLTLQTYDVEQLTRVGRSAENILNQIHDTEDAYQVVNLDEIADGIGQITNIMGIIIGCISGISLVVGGVGVMNIMLVSVTERTREIGIRKSLGATRRQILIQFLAEATIITTLGGIVGIILGLGGAYLAAYLLNWTIMISWPIILIALFSSCMIGIFFGFAPADKASQLDPIASLRYE